MLARLLLLVIIVIIAFAIKRHFIKGSNQTDNPDNNRNTNSNSKSKDRSRNKSGDSTTLSRKEALHILGLEDPVSLQEILQAYKRLINKVHPDKGGTDFFASQLNLAKEVLLELDASSSAKDSNQERDTERAQDSSDTEPKE